MAECICEVEAGGLGIEAVVPRLLLGVRDAGRGILMPNEGVDAALLVEADSVFNSLTLGSVGHSSGRVLTTTFHLALQTTHYIMAQHRHQSSLESVLNFSPS